MITFKELRRRLSESTGEPVDMFSIIEEWFCLFEDSTFYIYRTDTNAVIARGIQTFDAAKTKANTLRKQLGLKWDEVKFKMERPTRQFDVSRDGRPFTNAQGQRGTVDYSRNVNPSKGRRFRGYYDRDGNYHDID